MKVLYLTVPSFFDLEISLIRELSKVCQVRVMLFVSPESMSSSAFKIDKLYNESKIIRADEYEGMEKYDHLIDLKTWMIVNNPDNSFWSCWKLARKIKRFIKEENFDIIHSTTDCKTSLFLVPTIWKLKHTLFTTHDPFPHQKYSKFRKWLSYDLMFLTYKNLLLLSRSLEGEFSEIYRKKYKKIYYSKLGVYDFLKSFNTKRIVNDTYILFFGRIDYYKGVDVLIRAYQKSFLSNKKIKLVIAGKGNLSREKDNINDNVIIFNRYIENSELASLIKYSSFIVLPYRTVTQSGVLKSAYAFDKPVVATRVGSFVNEIKDGEGGILVAPSDENDMCRGLEQMVESDLQFFSENIHSRFSDEGEEGWSAIAHDLVNNVYKQIICNR